MEEYAISIIGPGGWTSLVIEEMIKVIF